MLTPVWLVYWNKLVGILKKLLKAAELHTELVRVMDAHLVMLELNQGEDTFEYANALYSLAKAWHSSKRHQDEGYIDQEVSKYSKHAEKVMMQFIPSAKKEERYQILWTKL